MIVAEMIYADARELLAESHKKRSLFEMMDDDYLAELDDRKFVHSMKMMLEDGFGDADQANSDNPNNGDNRNPAPVAEPETVDYGNVGDDDAYEPDSLTTTADDDNVIDTELPPLFTSDSNDDNISVTEPDSLTTTADDDNISVTEPDSLTTTADDDNISVTEPDSLTTTADDDNVIDTELPPLFTSDSDDDTDNTDDEEIVEPVVEPGEEDDDSTIITIDGTKYYDGLKYLNKISDEMPAVATESRLSLVDALYA